MAIDMFDNVRVRMTPLTEQLGLAGLVGQVYGDTTPSVTCVDVMGECKEDRAFNVNFPGRQSDLWFSQELLEFARSRPWNNNEHRDKANG